MPKAACQPQEILHAFRHQKVLSKQEILQAAGCSTMTAFRWLKQHGYLTSYNFNARYYTLTEIPKFDQHGLWSYRQARFSKWGSLTHTLVGLVQQSSAGMTARQLQQLLQLTNVKPALAQFVKAQSLSREKIDRSFVYFSSQPVSRRGQQKQRRVDREQAQVHRCLPPVEQVVALLVEIIRRPENTCRQWTRSLVRRGLSISRSDVQAVLDHYQIDPKKGLWKS